MPPLVNIEAVRRSQIYRLLGSFWTSVFKDRDQVRTLVDMAFRNRVEGDFQAQVANIAGDVGKASLVTYLEVPFRAVDVFQTGMFVFNDPDLDREYGTSFDAEIIYNSFRIRYYVLPLSAIIPLRIQTKERALILGTDFFISGGQWLMFREDPRVIFPTGNYLVIKGWNNQYRSAVSYLTKTETPGNDDIIVQWMRRFQTPQYFKLALAAVGRLGIIRKGGELKSVSRNAEGLVTYAFEDETVRVSYEHEQLIPGQVYSPNTVIGDVIQVLQAGSRHEAWWRQFDWRGGLSLDPLLPGFHGLALRDVPTIAYNAGQEKNSANGSKVHARVVLSDDFDSESKYWEFVESRERQLNQYINQVIGLGEETDGGDATVNDTYAKLVASTSEANAFNVRMGWPKEQPAFASLPQSVETNALDAFFQILLSQVSLVVGIDIARLPNPKAVYSFLNRELPAGATNIIFGYMSSMPTDRVQFGRNITVKDFVQIQEISPQSLIDVVDLGVIVRDYVSLTPIFPEP